MARRLKHQIYSKHRKTFDTLRQTVLNKILPASYLNDRWYSRVQARHVTVKDDLDVVALEGEIVKSLKF